MAAIVHANTPGSITLRGNTFPERKRIALLAGASWHHMARVWTCDNTPRNRAIIASWFSIAVTMPSDPQAQAQTQAQDTPPMVKPTARAGYDVPTNADITPDTPHADVMATIAAHNSALATVVNRTDKPDDTNANANANANANTDDSAAHKLQAAMRAFIAANTPTQAAQAAPLDIALVQDMIDKALAKQAPVSTSITIAQGDTTRVIDGLHHAMLPTLIKCVATGLNVWIAGPSGSGKTHSAEQCAKALGLTFALHGAMTMAHELTGFVDAAGHYHETPFVRAFRNGGLVLLDEIDAGSNEALLALNAALSNGVMCLPNGEIIRRHADFRCIGAANTWGQGATAEFVGRNKIDAAFLQRFGARLAWTFDEAAERAITGNDKWVDRVQNARRMAASAGLKVLITPRASYDGAVLLAAGFTSNEAADMTYLAGLSPDQRRQCGS